MTINYVHLLFIIFLNFLYYIIRLVLVILILHRNIGVSKFELLWWLLLILLTRAILLGNVKLLHWISNSFLITIYGLLHGFVSRERVIFYVVWFRYIWSSFNIWCIMDLFIKIIWLSKHCLSSRRLCSLRCIIYRWHMIRKSFDLRIKTRTLLCFRVQWFTQVRAYIWSLHLIRGH